MLICEPYGLLWQKKKVLFEKWCLVWLKCNNSPIFKIQLWTSTMRKHTDIKLLWIHVFSLILYDLFWDTLCIYIWRDDHFLYCRTKKFDHSHHSCCKYSCCLMLLSNYNNAEDWFFFLYAIMFYSFILKCNCL